MCHIISICKKKFFFFFILILFPQYSWAEDRFLESINVADEQDYSIVDIRLNQQLTVVSYAPLVEGKLLRLDVRITGNKVQINETPTDFETLPWKPTAKLPLYDIVVDLQGAIILHFKRTVRYEVLSATNPFHILVKVYHPVRKTELPEQVEKLPEKRKQPVEDLIVEKLDVIKGSQNPELAGFMNQARRAMLNKDYPLAIKLYTKVKITDSKSIYGKQALEYLGLARERNGQFAHAKAVYEQYLKLYPDGEDAERINQRLSGIIMAETEPNEKLKEGKAKENLDTGIRWDTFGSFSQFYNRHENKFNDNQTRINRSSLQNSLNLTLRLQSQDYQVTSRFSGTYNFNFEDSDGNENRISSLYLDLVHKPLDAEVRIGRQSRSSGGILGRFDGALLAVPLAENIKMNLVSGYSVLSSRDIFLNTDQYFYGVNFDIGTFFDSLDFNAFYIEQYANKLLDRRAIGGEVRYFQENHSFFSFLDYDLYHDVLNSFLFTGQWAFADRTIVNLSYDYRASPFLTTTNALQGQSFRDVEEIDELLNFFSRKEIKALARDRTANNHSLAISLSRPVSDQFQLNGDFRISKMSDTKTSGGVEGADGTGFEYSYSVDLTGSSLLTEGDIYVFGVRYNDLERSNSISATVNARYPVNKKLRINPRLRLDYRDNEDGTERYAYQASVRVTHRILKGLQLELEGGGQWDFQGRTDEILEASPVNDKDEFDRTKGYFVIVGYRYNF